MIGLETWRGATFLSLLPKSAPQLIHWARKAWPANHRLKVLTTDWPVVALASFGQESGPPNTQLIATLRNKGQRPTLFVFRPIRLFAGLLCARAQARRPDDK